MKTSLFYLPDVGNADEREQGMAGMRGDLYQRMLADLSTQARLADKLGYNSISFTEHHFHIEGFEMSNNPVLLDLYIGMQTQNIRVGQLGIVLPAGEPAAGGRGYRHAGPHDRRAGQCRLCARLSAPLGRCVRPACPWRARGSAGSA